MSDTVTILRSYSGQPQTKTLTSNGVIAVDQRIKFFVGSDQPVNDIYSVAAVLEAAATDPRNAIVRGEIIETVNRSRMLRRSVARPAKPATATTPAQAAEPATLRTVKRHWVLIDVDDYPLPPAFDQFADPATTVALIVALLPQEFQGATVWWSFTSSAGTNPKLYIRLGFWLSRPLGKPELKRLLGGLGSRRSIPAPLSNLRINEELGTANPLQAPLRAQPRWLRVHIERLANLSLQRTGMPLGWGRRAGGRSLSSGGIRT